ncbi:hypothetical protein [Promicromonospora sp. NPDC057488]
MPDYYRDSHAWQGAPRDLAIRLSVAWMIAGMIFVGGFLVIYFG